MANIKFEKYKLQNELNRNGESFEFSRPKVNDFNEKTKSYEDDKITITGLFHQSQSKQQIETDGVIKIISKNTPMVLCLYETSSSLQSGDVVNYKGKQYEVISIINIQEWGVISDIVLEVIN